jgi:flagellar protein FlaF
MSLAAYQRVRTLAETPRATEHRLISEVTRAVEEAWTGGLRGAALMPPLHRNRGMWSTFAASCGAAGNALPPELRAGVISLSLWVDRYTSAVIAGTEPVEPLLQVNRMLLDGLSPQRLAA